MPDFRCKNCIWAKRHLDDGPMVFCKLNNNDVYGDSLPCKNFEKYEEPF